MRSMRRIGGLVGAVVAITALTGASTASAVQITPAGTAFTASSTGEHVFSISSNIKVRCNQAKFTGTTSNPASASVAVTPTYGTATGVSGAWCRLYVGGVFSAATITATDLWHFQWTTYASGTSGGHTTTTLLVHIVVGACTIDVPAGTVVPIMGTNDDPSGLSAGITIDASGTGLSYTSSGCSAFGIPASGSTATYAGSAYASNIWVM